MNLVKKATSLVAGLGLIASFALAVDKSDWPKELNFGVIPTAGSAIIGEKYEPLVKYLEKRLERKVNLQIAGDYTGTITSMTHKHTDFAHLGPQSYVEAARRANAQAIAMYVNKDTGLAGYKGIIITKKGSGLKTLEDVKGKIWAFTESQSTSGTLIPTVMFEKKGIDPQKYFKKVIYSGNHEASTLSVKAGRIDVASTCNTCFEEGVGKKWKKEDFNFIWESNLIPSDPIAIRKDLPSSLKDEVQKAFIEYNDPEGLKHLGIQKYIKADDKTYDTIRELIELKNKMKHKK